MTAPAATSDAVRTSELRLFGGGCVVGRSAAARQARLVAATAQTIPCWGIRMVVVVNCCQNLLARMIDLRVTRGERLLCRQVVGERLFVVQICQPSRRLIGARALQRVKCRA